LNLRRVLLASAVVASFGCANLLGIEQATVRDASVEDAPSESSPSDAAVDADATTDYACFGQQVVCATESGCCAATQGCCISVTDAGCCAPDSGIPLPPKATALKCSDEVECAPGLCCFTYDGGAGASGCAQKCDGGLLMCDPSVANDCEAGQTCARSRIQQGQLVLDEAGIYGQCQ